MMNILDAFNNWRFKRINKNILPVMIDQGAMMPTRSHRTDAGMDLRSQETKLIPAGESYTFDTGVHVELPEGCAGLMVSKSGLNVNHSITSTGLIDEGYTGSIKVKLYNHSENPYMVCRGDKISQLVVIPVLYLRPVKVTSFRASERGNNGFGSTGK